MAARDLTERVELLDVKVSALEGLPERVSAVESQIVQLRDEMRGGFSAVHQEMHELGDSLRGEMHDLGATLRQEMREGQEDLRREMRGLEGTLRGEMRVLNEDTKNQMRVLHEDVIDRIARIGEGAPRPRRRRRWPEATTRAARTP
jgi:hypothetical protein